MKTFKQSPLFVRLRHNRLAHAISIALATLFTLKIAEAEAEDAVVQAAVNDVNLPSAASLDVGPVAPLAVQLSALQNQWSGIPYKLDDLHHGAANTGNNYSFGGSTGSMLAGYTNFMAKNGGTWTGSDSVINAQAAGTKVFVALDGGSLDLTNFQITTSNQQLADDDQSSVLLAAGENSVIRAREMDVSNTSGQSGIAVHAIDGGQIELTDSYLDNGLNISAEGEGARVTLAQSEAGGAWLQGGALDVSDSLLHGTVFVLDGSQLDIRNSVLDGAAKTGSAVVQINTWGGGATANFVDSHLSNANGANQVVEITGSADFTMQGGSITGTDTALAALLHAPGGEAAVQNIAFDGVHISATQDSVPLAREDTRGLVLAGDWGPDSTGHMQVDITNSTVSVSNHVDASDTATALGLSLYGSSVATVLDNSLVASHTNGNGTATGALFQASDSMLALRSGSEVRGETIGIDVRGASAAAAPAKVIVDHSQVVGEVGHAINVADLGKVDIEVRNGASLLAGSGTLLNVQDQGEANLTVNGSQLDGDIRSDGTTATRVIAYDSATGEPLSAAVSSTLNVALQNDARWTGIAANVDAMRIDGTSQWNMADSSNVASLDNGGTLVFQPGGAFKTLTVEGDLTGNGLFAMNTDLAREQGDLLKVLGTVQGSHSLLVADSGNEPGAANGKLMVVDGNGGDGSFALAGRPFVDAGAFRYDLEQQGDDWFLRNRALAPDQPGDGSRLDPRPQALSDGANAALGNQSATATLWNAEMNALVKRLGELRMGEDNGGVWARGIGKTFEVDNGSSRGYDQNVQGLEIGADTAITLDDGKLYVGAMVGAATSDQDFGDGSSGTIDSKLIGAYATWLKNDGYYVDTVAKYNRLDSETKTVSNTGEQVKGSYDTDGYGVDVEVGKHIKLQDGWFVEPQAELTYTHTEGASYTTSNGLEVEAQDSDSLQGRVGALFGKSMKLGNGMAAQPYVKASYVHEFAGDSSVTVNGYKLDNQVSGSRAEVGFGTVLQVSEKTKVSLDVEHAKGNDVEEPWAVNLGVRYLW